MEVALSWLRRRLRALVFVWVGLGWLSMSSSVLAEKDDSSSKVLSLQQHPGDDFPTAPYLRYLPYVAKSIQHNAWTALDNGSYDKGIAILSKAAGSLKGLRKSQAFLALGHVQMSLGDYNGGLRTYKSLLGHRSRSISWPARIMSARHFLQTYKPRSAWRLLASWSKTLHKTLKKPKTSVGKRMILYWTAGHLLRADALLRLGKKQDARESFDALLKANVNIADWVAYQRLLVLHRQKEYATVYKQTRQWLRQYQTSRWRDRVRLLRATAMRKTGRCRNALKLFKGLLKRHKGAIHKSARLGRIQCLMLLNQKTQAYKEMRTVARVWAGSWYATRVIQWMQQYFPKKSGLSVLYDKAYHAYKARNNKLADMRWGIFLRAARRQLRRDRFRRKRTKRKVTKRRLLRRIRQAQGMIPKAHYYYGRTLFRLKQYNPCKKVLEVFEKQYKRHSLAPRAQLVWIRANYRKERDLAAVRRYERFAKTYASRWYGRKSLWWAAQLYGEHKQTNKSQALFNQFFKKYKESSRRWEARIKMALVAYQRGRYRQTIKLLKPLRRFNSSTGVRAKFWTAKAYDKRGKKRRAKRVFRSIRPLTDSYYAARAQQRLTNEPVLAKAEISLYRLLSDESAEVRNLHRMKRWYKRRFKSGSWDRVVRSMIEHPSYTRAYVFALAGRWREVRQEWYVLRRSTQSPIKHYLESRTWLAYGNPNRALYYGGRFRRSLKSSKRKGLPLRGTLRLTFPVPFPYLYMTNGKAHKVRPLLMMSLTRQESLFHPQARSGAGARGIAQIMPKEGKRLARKWGIRGYRTQHLYRVSLNLKMGFHHFYEYLARHNHDVELTLAAYNAGPKPLQRWINNDPQLPKTDREAFIEYGIGYRETRKYVRNCLRWYSVYRQAFDRPRFGTRSSKATD